MLLRLSLKSKKVYALLVTTFLLIIVSLWIQAKHTNNFRVYSSHSDFLEAHVNDEVGPNIVTAWVFDTPLPSDVLRNIESLYDAFSGVPVRVYCGTSQCVDTIVELNNANITTEFLVASNLVRDTPLEEWFARHPLNKVLAGLDFEHHLQRVVQLGILWHHSGLFVDPLVRVKGDSSDYTAITKQSFIKGELDITYFPKHHPFIWTLAEHFVNDYPTDANKTFHFNVHDVLSSSMMEYCQQRGLPVDCLRVDSVPVPYEKHQYTSLLTRHHFGTLSYDVRTKTLRKGNLGDEIQAISGLQFLPFVDVFLERDNLSLVKTREPITAFFNAWWGDVDTYWPPPSNIHPIMTSMHITSVAQPIFAKNIDYLKRHSPIGCRDLSTLEFLRKHEVDSYFSACLTLMLRNPCITKKRTEKIYLVDIKTKYLRLLPTEVRKNGIRVKHVEKGMESGLEHFPAAYKLLESYASAKVVVTQRIHCALPCVGMGTPVIFIQSAELPGDVRNTTKNGSARTTGLTSMFHTLDVSTTSVSESKEWLRKFDWSNPPPNPNPATLMRLRATHWNVIRQNQALYDSARKFGMLPLPHPIQELRQKPDNKLSFHLVFETSNSTHGAYIYNWHRWRGVESIFHHHPFSKVTIHSNTLQQSEFDVLTEAGYAIEVQRYDLEEMVQNSPAQDLKLSNVRESPHSYDHQSSLLRLLILYKHGGVFMESDTIVVKPVGSLKNILAWRDTSNHSLSGTFMAFEKGSRFLRECLTVLTQHYNDQEWTTNTLTEVWKGGKDSSEVEVLKSSAFYLFHDWEQVQEVCLATIPNSLFQEKMRILKEEAYVVSLNSAPDISETIVGSTNGTMCNYLLNTYCVLCNNHY